MDEIVAKVNVAATEYGGANWPELAKLGLLTVLAFVLAISILVAIVVKSK